MAFEHSNRRGENAGGVNAPRFDVLLVGHDSAGSAEASLVLAAAAALSGLRCDGAPMPGGDHGRLPTLREIATELGLSIGNVRRGVAHLVACGAVRIAGGVCVEPDALRQRWADHRRRARITVVDRSRGLRAPVLLLLALIRGQIDRRGQLRLGVGFLAERIGCTTRTIERHLAELRRVEALHTWLVPGSWQLVTALGPKRRNLSEEEGRNLSEEVSENGGPGAGRHVLSGPDVTICRSPRRDLSVTPSRFVGRPPDSSGPVSPPDARATAPEQTPAPPSGETGPRSAAAEPEPAAAVPAPDVRAIVEPWVTAFARRGIERLADSHIPDVAGLLAALGPVPVVRDRDPDRAARRRAELHRDRAALARRVIAWCPSPERLGRWIVRVARRYRVENLPAYLRRAIERGDAGTVLESAQKNAVGRAAETWQDFTPSTERALEGEHARDVQRLVAGGVAVLTETDRHVRARLRLELRHLLDLGREDGARRVLLRLVGPEPNDDALAAAVAGVCEVARARRLLAA